MGFFDSRIWVEKKGAVTPAGNPNLGRMRIPHWRDGRIMGVGLHGDGD